MWVEKIWLITVFLRQRGDLIQAITVYEPKCQRIPHVRGFSSALAVQISRSWSCSAPACRVMDSKTLPAPVSWLRSWSANKLMRDINKMTAAQGGSIGNASRETTSNEGQIQGLPGLGWKDGNANRDQRGETQQSMSGEWGGLEGRQQMED